MNLRHETLKGMKENAIQGFHCGGRAPYGYRLVRTGAKVNYSLGPEHEVADVRRMFKMASEGAGGRKITRFLNELEAAREPSRKWSPSTVLSILGNHAYLGYRTWNKKSEVNGHKNPESEWIVTIDRHPAIIDLRLWEAAQSELLIRRAIHSESN